MGDGGRAGFCLIGVAGFLIVWPPETFDGQRQDNLLRTHPRQSGLVSSHFFLRPRQVKQPVRTRKIR